MNFLLPEKCLECGTKIEGQGHVECLACEKPCEPYAVNQDDIENAENGDMVGLDVKSQCCNADVKLNNVRSTCCDECHEKTYLKMESQMGKFIYDYDADGILREIPTRDIFEKGGLTHEELAAYPKAKDAEAFKDIAGED